MYQHYVTYATWNVQYIHWHCSTLMSRYKLAVELYRALSGRNGGVRRLVARRSARCQSTTACCHLACDTHHKSARHSRSGRRLLQATTGARIGCALRRVEQRLGRGSWVVTREWIELLRLRVNVRYSSVS